MGRFERGLGSPAMALIASSLPFRMAVWGPQFPRKDIILKRTHAAILITFVVALAASLVIQNGVLASTFTEETSPPAVLETFTDVAAAAERPADGLDLYDNIHRYMWRPVYMMAAVDLYLSESEDGEYYVSLERDTESGQYVAIRTWEGQAHITGGLIFNTTVQLLDFGGGLNITADALLFLEPGVDLPALEIEFVGTVCGTHQYVNDYFQVVNALPVICIEDDGVERIRPVPLMLVPVE